VYRNIGGFGPTLNSNNVTHNRKDMRKRKTWLILLRILYILLRIGNDNLSRIVVHIDWFVSWDTILKGQLSIRLINISEDALLNQLEQIKEIQKINYMLISRKFCKNISDIKRRFTLLVIPLYIQVCASSDAMLNKTERY